MTDLAGFAPEDCGHGHDLRVGAGHRRLSWMTCMCPAAREDENGGRVLFGHVVVECAGCRVDGRDVRFFDPPHEDGAVG